MCYKLKEDMSKTDDTTFEDTYRKFEKLSIELVEEDIEPTVIAGCMMGQAMKLYQLTLSPEDYEQLMQIVAQTSIVDELDRENFNTGTIH